MHGPDETIPGAIEIGIDTGGTFTDIVARGRGEPTRLLKIPSTPGDPSEAIIAGIRRIIDEFGIAPRRITRFVHGTTVGTNAVLEEKGARIGLLATAGFGDVLEIGRQVRDPMYAAKLRPATPVFLLPGARRKEVIERVDARGGVLVPLDEASVRDAAAVLVADGVEAIAICFLFAFLNPAHERRAAALIARDWPQLAVSLSSEVDPGFPRIRAHRRHRIRRLYQAGGRPLSGAAGDAACARRDRRAAAIDAVARRHRRPARSRGSVRCGCSSPAPPAA